MSVCVCVQSIIQQKPSSPPHADSHPQSQQHNNNSNYNTSSCHSGCHIDMYICIYNIHTWIKHGNDNVGQYLYTLIVVAENSTAVSAFPLSSHIRCWAWCWLWLWHWHSACPWRPASLGRVAWPLAIWRRLCHGSTRMYIWINVHALPVYVLT